LSTNRGRANTPPAISAATAIRAMIPAREGRNLLAVTSLAGAPAGRDGAASGAAVSSLGRLTVGPFPESGTLTTSVGSGPVPGWGAGGSSPTRASLVAI
jgi:hypothetical protein